ncbi:Uncharacterised protein [Mycobacteroides abscessus]|nr:Uncharacterised protein [Mycobacteroides abscessus]
MVQTVKNAPTTSAEIARRKTCMRVRERFSAVNDEMAERASRGVAVTVPRRASVAASTSAVGGSSPNRRVTTVATCPSVVSSVEAPAGEAPPRAPTACQSSRATQTTGVCA